MGQSVLTGTQTHTTGKTHVKLLRRFHFFVRANKKSISTKHPAPGSSSLGAVLQGVFGLLSVSVCVCQKKKKKKRSYDKLISGLITENSRAARRTLSTNWAFSLSLSLSLSLSVSLSHTLSLWQVDFAPLGFSERGKTRDNRSSR